MGKRSRYIGKLVEIKMVDDEFSWRGVVVDVVKERGILKYLVRPESAGKDIEIPIDLCTKITILGPDPRRKIKRVHAKIIPFRKAK